MRVALVFLGAAACNSILGNSDFTGPGSHVDACTSATCVDGMPDGMPDASMTCQNMGKPPTTITGKIFAPNGSLPLPNVLVYVPKNTPDALPTGVQCGCTPATGTALTSAITDANGNFQLTDPPTGPNVPIVIQLGKWRRQITLANVDACADNGLPTGSNRLPRNHTEGDMPSIAIATGAADELECLIRRVGIDDTEIGSNGDGRKVQLFSGFQPGANMFAAGYPGGAGTFGMAASNLTDPTKLETFDRVMFSCEGSPANISQSQAVAITDWANKGGQLLLEHYERVWMVMSPSWMPLATFMDANPPPSPSNVTIDQTFPKGNLLVTWLSNIGAGTGGTIPVINPRNTVMTADQNQVQVWAHLDPAQRMGLTGDQIFTFATPLGVPQGQQCGRVIFSDMHQNGQGGTGVAFPNECPAQALTPQEDVLAFLFFDEQTCLQ
ncbi:MAG TPA: hypothetical protein VL463_25785 [Kofleriaceae bacterium]|jgi:hypothetical protein|nr:hypothetical protein [Kofleriaceae bacterium]